MKDWLLPELPPTSRSSHGKPNGGVDGWRGRQKEVVDGEGILMLTLTFERLNNEWDKTKMRHDRQMGCRN